MKISYEKAAQYLLDHDNYLILTHKSPDGDTLGSAIALCLALRMIGKHAYILKNPGTTARYTARIEDLLAEDGYQPTQVVAVDIADVSMLPLVSRSFADRIDLAIDHHFTHNPYAKEYLVDAEAAACGEIIWEVIKIMKSPIDQRLAEAIYIAVSTDTSCFLNSNTTARTHQTVAELYPFGIDFVGINRTFFIMKTRARLAIEAALISNMNFYRDGQIAVIMITSDLISETGTNEDDMDNITSITRTIEGVELGISIRERADGKSKISMRSSERANVAKICEHFGGGGHVRAAGCSLDLPPKEAEEMLIQTILNENLY